MKKTLSLTVLLFVFGVALAGTGMTGVVVDGTNQNPVEGALVMARGDNGVVGQARTNARGVYVMDQLRPGSYHVKAAARGYEPAVFPRPVPVRAGEVTEDVSFRLRPVQQTEPGVITGRVVDRVTGEPVENGRVVAFSRNGRRAARTDAHGNYAIRGLRPGTYKVVAGARGYLKQNYPQAVDVRPGQTVENVNFGLIAKPRKGAIAGQVLDARTREPIAGAVVVAHGEHDAARAVTDRHGNYKLRLAPGTYRVSAAARGYGQETFPRPVPVHPHEVTRDVSFGLHRTVTDSD